MEIEMTVIFFGKWQQERPCIVECAVSRNMTKMY